MSDYKPAKGDRVRVVFEGEVSYINNTGTLLDLWVSKDGEMIGTLYSEHLSIEKIEPLVEVFKPGDVVRSKSIARFRYVIGRDGYFSFQGNDFREHDEDFMEQNFTSERYERVELG